MCTKKIVGQVKKVEYLPIVWVVYLYCVIRLNTNSLTTSIYSILSLLVIMRKISYGKKLFEEYSNSKTCINAMNWFLTESVSLAAAYALLSSFILWAKNRFQDMEYFLSLISDLSNMLIAILALLIITQFTFYTGKKAKLYSKKTIFFIFLGMYALMQVLLLDGVNETIVTVALLFLASWFPSEESIKFYQYYKYLSTGQRRYLNEINISNEILLKYGFYRSVVQIYLVSLAIVLPAKDKLINAINGTSLRVIKPSDPFVAVVIFFVSGLIFLVVIWLLIRGTKIELINQQIEIVEIETTRIVMENENVNDERNLTE